MKLKDLVFSKGYSVKLRLILFVITAVALVLFISLSAVIGLNNTYHGLSNLRDRSQNQMLMSMTLGVKTTQISTYAIRLSQTIRALEYQEASNQLERHLEQVHYLLRDVKQQNDADENQLLSDVVNAIEALEQTVKDLLLQAHQRHILTTTIISQLNQSVLHIRHLKRLEKRQNLPRDYLAQLERIETLIDEAVQSNFSPNGFASIQAMFHFLPSLAAYPAMATEWQKVEQLFHQLIENAKQLSQINLRIQYLTYRIDALVKHIDRHYTQLAQDKIDDVNRSSHQTQQALQSYQNAIVLFALFIIVLVIVLGIYLYQLIGKRLSSITHALTQLSVGDKSVRVPQQQTQDEIGDLARAFHLFYQQVLTLDRTDALLKEKSELLEQTYLAMRDGLAIFDPQLRLISCNAQFSTLLQGMPSDVPNWTIDSLALFLSQQQAKIYGTEQGITPALLQEVRAEQEPLELDYNQQVLEWRISRRQDGGLVAFLIDRTQRKKLETDLAHSQKMRSIGHLTGGIAHDFNNFLAVIIGNLDLIDPSSLSEKQANRLNRAMKAAENSATLTQRLLAYARKQPLHPTALNINQLLMEFADLIKHTLPANIKLQLDLAEHLPPVYIDKNQLETALVNLIVNAKDAITGEGEIRIATQQKQVQRTDRLEQMVQISVSDTGCGMSDATQKRVFEPFFTTKKQHKGSGLGLSMVYGFIRQSKGRIQIESAVGQGTTMLLQLPIAQGGVATEAISAPQRLLHKGRILLVEDQAALRHTLTEQLNDAGFDTVAVESAEQGVRLLEKSAKVDYLLSDIALTGMSGIELARYVRQHYPHIHILLMTGNQTEIADNTPQFPILNKPFKQQRLFEMLENITQS
ncbi:MAG: ATP-binding protein [Pasteurellaceae bacterium]|nr:ATP-binding protein [Pasteurellaceae bacterium]